MKRHSLLHLAASALDFPLAAMLRALMLQREPAQTFVCLLQEKEGLQKLNLVPQEKNLLH